MKIINYIDYDSILNLPTSINEINSIVERLSAQKKSLIKTPQYQ